MKRVKEGHRLEKPEHCDREYTLLLDKLLVRGHEEGQGGAQA